MITFLLACSSLLTPTLEEGTLSTCLDGNTPANDVSLDFDGTLTAAEPGDCGYAITVDDGAGTTHVAAFDLKDPDGNAITPDLGAAVGSPITLSYRSRLVWGSVGGFALFDDAGLVLAVEEGTWGGALGEVDLGVTVTTGTEAVAYKSADCQDLEGYTLNFAADDSVELTPFEQADLTVDGATMTATAVAAWDYAKGGDCSMSDTTNISAWALFRQ